MTGYKGDTLARKMARARTSDMWEHENLLSELRVAVRKMERYGPSPARLARINEIKGRMRA